MAAKHVGVSKDLKFVKSRIRTTWTTLFSIYSWRPPISEMESSILTLRQVHSFYLGAASQTFHQTMKTLTRLLFSLIWVFTVCKRNPKIRPIFWATTIPRNASAHKILKTLQNDQTICFCWFLHFNQNLRNLQKSVLFTSIKESALICFASKVCYY